jgi:hypothetical protein
MKDKSLKTASRRTFLAAYAIAFLPMVSTPLAQTPGTAAISGIVYDPATRVGANAEVSAVNDATGISRSVTTSSEGVLSQPRRLHPRARSANGTSLADQDFGDSGVGFIRGPGQHNQDMAAERVFPVRESTSFRFRAEFFNVTNTPQFGNPSTSLGYTDPTLLNPSASPTFGKITGTVANPRIIQFAAKFVF